MTWSCAPCPSRTWTVQISLMIGIAAAEMMRPAGRDPADHAPPDRQVIQRFRRQARALGVTWPAELLYGVLLRSLDRTNPRHLVDEVRPSNEENGVAQVLEALLEARRAGHLEGAPSGTS